MTLTSTFWNFGSPVMPASWTERKRMLLVDDDGLLGSLIRTTLGHEELDFLQADHGGHALAVARSEQPDLVLIDADVAGQDAAAVCQTLRQDPALADLKIVLLVQDDQPEKQQRGLAAGADATISWPFRPRDLVATVRGLLSLV